MGVEAFRVVSRFNIHPRGHPDFANLCWGWEEVGAGGAQISSNTNYQINKWLN